MRGPSASSNNVHQLQRGVDHPKPEGSIVAAFDAWQFIAITNSNTNNNTFIITIDRHHARQ